MGNKLRVGSLVYDTVQGLGLLAKSFVDNGVVTDVMVVEHGRRPSNRDWYPNSPRISDIRDTERQAGRIINFCRSIDVFLAFETPFVWEVFNCMRELGKKSVLMPMYECEPKVLPALPDLILCPSLLDLSYYPQGKHIPVPIDVPWRQRTRAEVFVHNAGNGGLRGRNGTAELVEAIRYVKSPAKFLIRGQERFNTALWADKYAPAYNCFRYGTLSYQELWRDGGEGDVFVFPEKFNGLSLPLQEARAAGMLVMATDRFPMNMWLPGKVDTTTHGNETFRTFASPLIPKRGVRTANVSPRCNDFEEAVVDPRDIAAKIDEWYGRDVSSYSLGGREWAETMSWEALKPRYVEVLEGLCGGR